MLSLRAFVVALAGVTGFGLACGLPGCDQLNRSNDDDAADAAPPTVKEYCAAVMSAYCSRANECWGEDPNSCFADAVTTCCGKNCDKPSTTEEHAIRVCVADIGREACEDVLAAQLPARCDDVIKYD